MHESAWICCHVITFGTLVLPRKPYWFGSVELSPLDWDDAECSKARDESMALHDVVLTPNTKHQFWRGRVVIVDATGEEAVQEARQVTNEAIDLFRDHCLYLVKGHVTDAGYLQNLKNRRIRPLRPPFGDPGMPITAGFVDLRATHPNYILNQLLSAKTPYGELGEAVRRSSHWRQLARAAKDDGERFMLNWMAVECLCRVDRNECMSPKFCALVGFPGNSYARAMTDGNVQKEASTQRYVQWKRLVVDAFESLRDARNSIAHSGFRHLDLNLEPLKMALAKELMPLLPELAANMALKAISNGETTVVGMWNAYPRDVNPNSDFAGHIKWCLWRLDEIAQAIRSKASTRKGIV